MWAAGAAVLGGREGKGTWFIFSRIAQQAGAIVVVTVVTVTAVCLRGVL